MEVRGPRKAFLLAAGPGTRLKELTRNTPKCLLPVGGKPILHWWLKILEELGVEEATVNTHHLASQVSSFLSSRRYGLKVRVFHEPDLLGSAGTIAANRDFVAGEPSFWILYADTLVGADLGGLSRLHEERKSSLTIGLFRPPDPRDCGVVELGPGGRVVSFEEKPQKPRSDLAAAGVYLSGPGMLEVLPARGDLGRDVLPRMLADAHGMLLEGRVLDIGTPETYDLAKKEWPAWGFERRFQEVGS